MGCVLPQEETRVEKIKANEDNKPKAPKGSQIRAGAGAKQQGAKELKRNYKIDSSTKVLGVGAFGKVFATHNLFDTKMKVAIKVMDKE